MDDLETSIVIVPAWRIFSVMRCMAGLLAATGAFIIAGCGAAVLYSKSAPVPTPGAKRYHNGTVTFPLSALDLSVQAQNWTPQGIVAGFVPLPIGADTSGHGRLAIWIEIAPHDSDIEIDPREIVVISASGDRQGPSGYWGPGTASLSSTLECRCGKPRPETEVRFSKPFTKRHVKYAVVFGESRLPPRLPQEPVHVERPTCFVLLFDGLRAGRAFSLSISAATAGGRALSIPPVRFKETWDTW